MPAAAPLSLLRGWTWGSSQTLSTQAPKAPNTGGPRVSRASTLHPPKSQAPIPSNLYPTLNKHPRHPLISHPQVILAVSLSQYTVCWSPAPVRCTVSNPVAQCRGAFLAYLSTSIYLPCNLQSAMQHNRCPCRRFYHRTILPASPLSPLTETPHAIFGPIISYSQRDQYSYMQAWDCTQDVLESAIRCLRAIITPLPTTDHLGLDWPLELERFAP